MLPNTPQQAYRPRAAGRTGTIVVSGKRLYQYLRLSPQRCHHPRRSGPLVPGVGLILTEPLPNPVV